MEEPVVMLEGEWDCSSSGCWNFHLKRNCFAQSIILDEGMDMKALRKHVEDEFGVDRETVTTILSYWLPTQGDGLVSSSKNPPVSVGSDMAVHSFRKLRQGNNGLTLCVTFKTKTGLDLNRTPGRTLVVDRTGFDRIEADVGGEPKGGEAGESGAAGENTYDDREEPVIRLVNDMNIDNVVNYETGNCSGHVAGSNNLLCSVADSVMVAELEIVEAAARENANTEPAMEKGKAKMVNEEEEGELNDSYGSYTDSTGDEEDYDYDFWDDMVRRESYYYEEELRESEELLPPDPGTVTEFAEACGSMGGTSPAGGLDQSTYMAVPCGEAVEPNWGAGEGVRGFSDGGTLNDLVWAAVNADTSNVEHEGVTGDGEGMRGRAEVGSCDDDDFVDATQNREVFLPSALVNITRDIRRDSILPSTDVVPEFEEDYVLTGTGPPIRMDNANDALYLGRVFKDRLEMQNIMAVHAIKNLYNFVQVRCDPHRLILRCADRSCAWRVFGHTMGGESTNMEIRTATFTHTCDVMTRSQYPKRATSKVIGAVLKQKYAHGKKGPRAVEIPEIVLAELNVAVNYMKAWRAKEAALEKARGTDEEAYGLLRGYMYLLQQVNPGTVFSLKSVEGRNGGERFKYLFLALGASIQGIPYLRRVIVIDGTAIKARLKGCLMTASFQDGNYQIFPLGFGVVDGEDHAAWSWFFEQLSAVVPDSEDLVFVSDRHSAIYSALREVYPKAGHGACSVHLFRNVKSRYTGKGLAYLVSKAARAYSLGDFRKWFGEIHKRNSPCADYLNDIGFEHWTRCFFPGMRYNLHSSNIAEALNAALCKALELPILSMVEAIRMLMMQWFCWRRAKAGGRESELTEEVDNLLTEHLKEAKHLSVVAASAWIFQVNRSDGQAFTVDLEKKCCTCKVFDKLLIPCCHALVAARCCKVPIPVLVSTYYTTETWRAVYSGIVMPVPNREDEIIPAEAEEDMEPPATRRGPGRRRTVRIPSTGETSHKKARVTPHRCSRCLKAGHNRQTCKNPLD